MNKNRFTGEENFDYLFTAFERFQFGYPIEKEIMAPSRVVSRSLNPKTFLKKKKKQSSGLLNAAIFFLCNMQQISNCFEPIHAD